MNTLKYGLISAVLVSSAFAQEPGFFVGISGGTARMKIGDFAVYNPVASIPGQPLGEVLPALDRKDSVAVTRLTVGYTLNPSWDFHFSFAHYGTAEVPVAFPLYPGMVFITAPDVYTRHVLVYKTSALTFIPYYRFVPGEKLTVRAGVGLNLGMSAAHFESSRRVLVGGTSSNSSFPKSNDTRFSYIASVGADYQFTKNLSAGISVNYTTMKAKIPTSPWANRTKSSVTIDALSTELGLTWHW